jgi:hypothetical protein
MVEKSFGVFGIGGLWWPKCGFLNDLTTKDIQSKDLGIGAAAGSMPGAVPPYFQCSEMGGLIWQVCAVGGFAVPIWS